MIDTSKYEGHTEGPWCYDMHAEWAEEYYYLGEEERQLWRDRELKASKEAKEQGHEPHLSPMIEQYEKDADGKYRHSTFCVRILRGLLWKSDYSGYRFGDENGFISEGREGTNIPTPDEIRANARLIADAPLLLEEVKRLHTEIAMLKSQYQSCQESLMDQTNWSVRLVEAIDSGKMSEIKRVYGKHPHSFVI